MKSFSVINIQDYAEIMGDDRLKYDISNFSCPINTEIERFVLSNSLDFARGKLSVTYFVLNERGDIVAIFTLTHKSIEIESKELSKTKLKKLSRYAALNPMTDKYQTSAFLIAQFGKNYSIDNGESISGNEIMELTMEILENVQYGIGGGIVYLECEDKPELLGFYQNEHNGFIRFGERYSDEDNKKYIQLFNFL
jgi:hypothetical protein